MHCFCAWHPLHRTQATSLWRKCTSREGVFSLVGRYEWRRLLCEHFAFDEQLASLHTQTRAWIQESQWLRECVLFEHVSGSPSENAGVPAFRRKAKQLMNRGLSIMAKQEFSNENSQATEQSEGAVLKTSRFGWEI